MAHEYVKISELDSTASFGTADQFVIVQNEQTLKINGSALIESMVTLTNLATRSYVDAVVDSAPGTLDTLRELAAALNDDANFGATVTNLINEKLSISNFGLEFWNQLATVNTYHISEGNNLYWTQERFDSALAGKNTYHIAEGSNLYFTEQRVHDVLDSILPPLPPDRLVSGEYEIVLGSDGKLTLPAEPTSADHAATKGYVDSKTSAIESFSGSYNDLTDKPTAPTFTSVTATYLNVQNVTLTGSGPCTFTSGNDLNFVATGAITFNGSEAITKTQLKSIVAASADFADFKARIAAL